MFKDFAKFLKEFNVMALAIGFIMGTASTSLINSFVKDILMPIITPLVSSDSWKEASVTFGPITLAYGSFVAELLNFLILAFIIFIVARKLLKMESNAKK